MMHRLPADPRVIPPAAPLPPGTGDGPLAQLHEHLGHSRRALDEIARLMRAQGGPGVLETATLTIGASGYAERSFRVPYAAVAAYNLGAGQVIGASAAAQDAPPGGGHGQVIYPAGGFAVWPITGTTFTFYGTPGATLVYTVLTSRVPPSVTFAPS